MKVAKSKCQNIWNKHLKCENKCNKNGTNHYFCIFNCGRNCQSNHINNQSIINEERDKSHEFNQTILMILLTIATSCIVVYIGIKCAWNAIINRNIRQRLMVSTPSENVAFELEWELEWSLIPKEHEILKFLVLWNSIERKKIKNRNSKGITQSGSEKYKR